MSVIGNPLLLSPEGYQIERSMRLRSSASAYFNRTPASAGNRKTWTWSGWVKRGQLGTIKYIASAYYATSSGRYNLIRFDSADKLNVWTNIYNTSSSATQQNTTTAVFRDPSAWYHVVIAFDSTNATASSRLAIYVNGISQTYSGDSITLNQDTFWNGSDSTHKIGDFNSADYFDGYLTEINFIDGQALTPSSFGETDAVTGVWKPKKFAGTYGTNGFYLNFSDPASTTTIGYDYSGNGNNWTSNNISVTAGVTYDSMIDVPTPYDDGGNGRGNYAVLNPLSIYVVNPTDGNLAFSGSSAGGIGSMGVSSGKYYWESVYTAIGSGDGVIVGVRSAESVATGAAENVGYYGGGTANGKKIVDGGTGTSYGATWTTGDVIGVALDIDGGSITFYKNNVSQGAISYTFTGKSWVSFNWRTGAAGTNTGTINFGQRPFAYTPPTGFKALNTGNLPEPTIVDGGEYFNTVLYTGNGTADRAIDTGLATDLFWVKQRSGANVHYLTDIVRGPLKGLSSNLTDAESTFDSVRSFTSTGVTVGTSATTNSTGQSYVAWNWKANGAGVTNTAGSITSTVSAGVTQGFSVVTWAGTSTNASTIGHGLGVAPKMIITKGRTNATSWVVGIGGISGMGVNDYLTMNTTSAKSSSSTFYQAYGSSTFTVGVSAANEMNKTGNNYVSYCFAEVPGFSKFGSYTGNGSADGTFVFCGFRPRFVMIKRTDGADSWAIFDSARDTNNAEDKLLRAESSNAEASMVSLVSNPFGDFLSNGFKIKNTSTIDNANGGTYIYAAFAEHPFKHSLAR